MADKQSIFYSSLRSFFVSAFGVVGFGMGVLFVLSVAGGVAENGEVGKSKKRTHLEVLPNAKGERADLGKEAPVILRIDIAGMIGSEKLNYDIVHQQLIESREYQLADQERIKGILLYIQSPGGTFVDSDGIYRLIKEYKEQYNLPVYAHVDGFCASGAMYIACAADKIYAGDSSLIGSVGVIIPSFLNFSGAMEKVGVESRTLSIGEGKDAMNPLRPWKENEEENYRIILDYLYDGFVNVVVSNRPNLSEDTLKFEIGARMLPAEKALEYGLIDQVGYSFNETLAELAQGAGIEDHNYRVVRLRTKSWISDLFEAKFPALGINVNHQMQLPGGVDAALSNQPLYLYQ